MEINLKNKKVLKDILIYLGLVLMVSGAVLIQRIGNLDEIWVYNFARGIANRTFAIQRYKHDYDTTFFIFWGGVFENFWRRNNSHANFRNFNDINYFVCDI